MFQEELSLVPEKHQLFDEEDLLFDAADDIPLQHE